MTECRQIRVEQLGSNENYRHQRALSTFKSGLRDLANLEPEDPGIPLTYISAEPLHEFRTVPSSL
jgi:hypothetical protein